MFECLFHFSSFAAALCSGGPGGKGEIKQALQEKLSSSHADAGEPDENGEGRAGGHSGSPARAEERLETFTAESRRTKGYNGEASSRAQMNQMAKVYTSGTEVSTFSRCARKQPSTFGNFNDYKQKCRRSSCMFSCK